MAPEGRRTTTWLLIVAAVAVAGALVAGVVLFGSDAPGTAPQRKVVAEAPDDAPATETPSAEPVPTKEAPSEKPTIATYANKLSGKTIPPNPKRTESPVPVPPNQDGCDHAYGSVTACIPWNFEPSVTTYEQKCQWLIDNDYANVSVRPPDRHALDPNKNGVACDG